MPNLKQAYDSFVEALKEETGAIPDINIGFHGHCKGNVTLNMPFKASFVANRVAHELGAAVPQYHKEKEHEWLSCNNHEYDLHIAVHFERGAR